MNVTIETRCVIPARAQIRGQAMLPPGFVRATFLYILDDALNGRCKPYPANESKRKAIETAGFFKLFISLLKKVNGLPS